MSEPKIYVPRSGAKLRSKNKHLASTVVQLFRDAPQGERLILGLSFKADEFIAFIQQHKNERGYINLSVTARREDGQFGDQFCVWLDTWQPRERLNEDQVRAGTQQMREAVERSAPPARGDSEDDVPF